jgi:hypothetical protein
MRRLPTAALPIACLLCLELVSLPVLAQELRGGRPDRPPAPAMTASMLERLLDRPSERPRRTGRSSCVADPNGGWDYVCFVRGRQALYDVSANRIVDSLVIR